MEQNIVSIGYVPSFQPEIEAITKSLLEQYEILKKIDGTKINLGSNGGYTELKTQAAALQVQIKALQAENLRLTQSILEGKKAAQESAAATKAKSEADKEAAKATREASEFERELAKERKKGASEAVAQAKIAAQLTDEYGLLSKALKDQELRYKNLALVHGIESAAAKEALKTALDTRAVLDKLDGNLKNYQRNVGNYKSAFDGLGMSFTQVARELPSLTISAQQFFLAISNNLPMVFDEIKKAKAEIAALKAQGQESTSLLTRVMGSLFSWNLLLSAGITILTAYGKEIGEAIKGLFGYTDELEKAAAASEKLQKAQLSLIQSQRELKGLYEEPITDANRMEKDLQIAQALGKSKLEILEIEKRIAKEKATAANDEFMKSGGFTTLQEYKKELLLADIKYRDLVRQQGITQNEDDNKELDKQIARAKVRLDLAKDQVSSQQEIIRANFNASTALQVAEINLQKEREKKAEEQKELADRTAEEILRINLEVSKRYLQFIIDRNKQDVDNDELAYHERLEALSRFNDAKIAMLEVERQYEIDSEKLKYEEIKKNLKDTKPEDVAGGQAAIDAQMAREKDVHLRRLANLESKYYDELRKLGSQYLSDIKKMDEQREKDVAASFEKELKVQADKIKAQRALIDEFQEAKRQARLKEIEQEKEKHKILYDFTKDFANKAVDLVQTLIDAGYTRQQNALQKLIDANNRYEQAELDRIANTTVSEQEKAAMVVQLNARTAAKNKELEDEQRQARIKQAEFDKAMSIAKITLNTAIAATNAMTTGDPYSAGLRAGIVIALGAAELAIALATPIPTYAEGGVHPGGPAIYGEAGPELVKEPGKAPYMVDKATLGILPAGTELKPMGDMINQSMYNSMLQSWAQPYMTERIDKGLKEVKEAIIEQGWQTQQAIRNQKKGGTNIIFNGDFGRYLQSKVIN